uniref:Titin n=1 Tax=Oryzias latipes TaxID=8090 RepID=A0A3B3IF30_ORYLA
ETDSVRLICEVSKPTADVVWYKGEQELPEGGRYDQIVDGKKRILLIQNLQTSDAGEYNCRLSPTIKTSGNLKINGKEKKSKTFISRPQNQEVVEGQKAEFTCSVSKETYNVKWMKDNKELEEGEKYQMVSDGKRRSLVIKNCEPKDEGGYVVVIGATRANAGKPIVMAIPYTAYPKAEAEWLYNNQSLPTDSIYTSADCTEYRLKDPKKSDEGRYKVLIKNKHGGGEAFINLDVIGKCCAVKPTMTGCQLTPNLDTRLGIPVPTAKWSIEGEEITSEGNIKIDTDNFSTILSINECTRNHTGTYLLTVSNAAGSKTVGLNVTVLDVPAAPIGPVNILEVTPDSMTIEWRPPKEDGGSPITNYIVDKRESNKETWGGVSSGSLGTELKITRLQRGAEYVVRIRAENKMGVGAPLESKPTVAEHSFMPPSPPGKPQSYDLSEDSVTVGWTMPLADGGSQITGYLIERRHKGGKWIRVNRIPCKDLRYRVLGLFEGNEYEFRVFAENIAGYSGPSPISDPCKPCRPITVPRPPINPKIKDYSKTTADLVWTKPSKDGGSPILGYTVEMRKGDAEEWKKVNLDDFIKLCAYQVKGLEEGVAYKFRVYASNMVGDGEAKEIPDSIVAQDILIPPEIEMDAACRERVTTLESISLLLPMLLVLLQHMLTSMSMMSLGLYVT